METRLPGKDFNEEDGVPVGPREKREGTSPSLPEAPSGWGCDAAQDSASLAETCGSVKRH